MTTPLRQSILAVFIASALAATGCSQSVQYFHVTVNALTPPSGMNCGTQTDLVAWSGISSSEEWAIYPAPNNQFLLSGSITGYVMTGTQKGNVYTFTGTDTNTFTPPGPNSQPIADSMSATLTLTMQGSGFTGSLSEVESCTTTSGSGCDCDAATGFGCLNANGQNFNSGNGQSYSCSESSTVAGTLLPNVTPQHVD